MSRSALLGILVSVIVAISSVHARADDTDCPPNGVRVPNFTATVPRVPVPQEPFVKGEDALGTLGDYRGRGVLLNFWATWCVPCVREMPSFSTLQERLAADGGRMSVVTLSQDRGGQPVVDTFFEKKKISNLPAFLDKRSRLGRALMVNGLPTTVLIDPDGNEVGRVVGSAEWDSEEMRTLIDACIAPRGAG